MILSLLPSGKYSQTGFKNTTSASSTAVHTISVAESADRSEIGEKHLKPPKSTPHKRQSDNSNNEGDCPHCHAFTRGPRLAEPCHETIRGARGCHHTERHRPCGRRRRGRRRRGRSIGCRRRRGRPRRRRRYRGRCTSHGRRRYRGRSRRGTRKSRHNSCFSLSVQFCHETVSPTVTVVEIRALSVACALDSLCSIPLVLLKLDRLATNLVFASVHTLDRQVFHDLTHSISSPRSPRRSLIRLRAFPSSSSVISKIL
nr:MAG TPA: hypothetical protein [Caudoviricetes sp.]